MGDQYDAPNQQTVRPDGSGPADEGEGGTVRKETEKVTETDRVKTEQQPRAKSKPQAPKSEEKGKD